MDSYRVKILETFNVTHDVKCFRLEKPTGYHFVPGQATDVSIPQPGLESELRPFTFTALADKPFLEFTIKRYPDHKGVTDHIHNLKADDELVIHDAWGAINYKGPGYFIAGGAGITPFIAILRDLYSKDQLAGNKLFFSNKTAADIIYEEELKKMLGENVAFILSREESSGYHHGRIDRKFLEDEIVNFEKHFYVCGPDAMVSEISSFLQKMGADEESVVFEK